MPTRGTTARKRSTRAKPLPFVLRESDIQGLGAFALERIRKGKRIIEYVGERISHEEAAERYDDDHMERHHTFLFTIDDKTVIDAAVGGNESRFINHSCEPNCEAVDEDGRIFIEALRDIEPGEELLYDYRYERDDDYDPAWEQLYVCHCGAPSCRGTILAPIEKPAKKQRASVRRGKGTRKKSKGSKRTGARRSGGKTRSRR